MLRIFNTLVRKKEAFKPIKPNRVGLYTCGPTVYNYAHIGNLRTYIFEDILRRTLEHDGLKVKHVMNITDVDDKIIKGAIRTESYEKAFFDDIKKLNIKKSWKYPKATEHVPAMITLINKLLRKKIAYRADDGVYFNISKFKKYGKLSGVQTSNVHLDVGRPSGVWADEYSKSDARDFALWKFRKSGEPSWKAPFGEGRPGWHIECSAMSMKYLGEHFDIHAGGVDLLFPHHENEIAQSEAATGKTFVNYFVEGEHLLVEGKKMSKSLGNIFTLRDIELKGFSPLAFRYLTLGTHYRSKLNFSWKALQNAQNSLDKLYEKIRELKEQVASRKGRGKTLPLTLSPLRSAFFSALSDDLNTPKALAILWRVIKNVQPPTLDMLNEFDKVLGLGLKNIEISKYRNIVVPASLKKLAAERDALRKAKKWREADAIRDSIRKKGYEIKDTPAGPVLSPFFPPF